MLRIIKITYVSDYKLKILFSNGILKIVNFQNWILEGGSYLEPLKEIHFFKQVHLDGNDYSICWPNGADFSPEALYAIGQEASSIG